MLPIVAALAFDRHISQDVLVRPPRRELGERVLELEPQEVLVGGQRVPPGGGSPQRTRMPVTKRPWSKQAVTCSRRESGSTSKSLGTVVASVPGRLGATGLVDERRLRAAMGA